MPKNQRAKQLHRERVLRQARASLSRGWSVVPLKPRSKQPSVADWPNLRLTADGVEDAFPDGANIGVNLGEASGDLVDIDLDAPQAVVAASRLFAVTDRIHGRASSPHSHRLYTSPGVQSQKFADVDGKMLLEIRSKNSQTMIPPSIHPSGEHLRWERIGEPATVPAEELVRMTRHTAAAALVARHMSKSNRHNTALAIAGTQVRSGWTEDAAVEFALAVSEAAGDEEPEDREIAVRSTYRNAAEGKNVTGLPTLAELLGEDVSRKLSKWLSVDGESSVGPTGQFLVTELHRQIRRIVVSDQIQSFDKRRFVHGLIDAELNRIGRTLRTADGRTFFFHDGERHLYDLEQGDFINLFKEISGLAATEEYLRFSIDGLRSTAARKGQLTEIHTLAHFQPERNLMVVSDGGGGVWSRERGGDWQLGRNGDNGVLFLTESEAEPWTPDFKGHEHALRWYFEQFMLSDRDRQLRRKEQLALLRVWLLHQFFPPLRKTRTIPAFLGAQGSGKSSALRLIGRLLTGPDFEVSALQREKEDGFVAGITSRIVLGLDNADSRIPWLPDSLARYATGQRYRLRRLYTTNDEVAYSPRAMLMLSSRDPQFNRPDVAERLLPLYCERPGVYRPEAEIYSELTKRRPSIMADLLATIAMIADRVDTTPRPSRPIPDGRLCIVRSQNIFADWSWRRLDPAAEAPRKGAV